MDIQPPAASRTFRCEEIEPDLCVVGGGLAGTCCAITAARAGAKVVLMQDRPVLGGNASSEVRLWAVGATVHMGQNNRWAREGGVINEILVENTFRNRLGNPVIVDTILLEKVYEEPNLTLLLNTAAIEVEKDPDHPDRIAAVRGFCSQNSTMYHVRSPLFCDASGDGVLGFLSGAAFRMGAESKEEFDESFAPDEGFGHLLGHSIYFYTKDIGEPVRFHPPSYALKDVPKHIPRYRTFSTNMHGCHLWWIEYGGRLDTVHDTEAIKWELWRIVYGVWDYIKNSGEFPDAETKTLEWVGLIPGKRESRRFEGDHWLTQHDVIERRQHHDDVAFGGWSIDLHPADGVYSDLEGAKHMRPRGIYPIPYRCYYSRNIENLFLAGRIISASHVAFGSTRVMLTCAHGGQAVGMAAAICARAGDLPRALADEDRVGELQQALLAEGQHIPGLRLDDPADLAKQATITASSELALAELPANLTADQTTDRDAEEGAVRLVTSEAQMLPLNAGPVPKVTVTLDVDEPTTLHAELRTTSDARHHCPDVTLAEQQIELTAGTGQEVTLDFDTAMPAAGYGFVILHADPHIAARLSAQRLTGVLRVRFGEHVNYMDDDGPQFDTYRPERRPGGHNLALRLDPPLPAFEAAVVTNGVQRPTDRANAWLPAMDDAEPALTLRWDEPVMVGRVELSFDVDYDHAMETVFRGHADDAMPFCVKAYRLRDGEGRIVHECADNHQARNTIRLAVPIRTDRLVIEPTEVWGDCPPAVYEVRCYPT